MIARTVGLALLTACLIFIAAPTTHADQIILTSGFISGQTGGVDHPYAADFAGEGFSLQQHADEAYFSNLTGMSLTPGQTVTVNDRFF
jgi:hypothetical protein